MLYNLISIIIIIIIIIIMIIIIIIIIIIMRVCGQLLGALPRGAAGGDKAGGEVLLRLQQWCRLQVLL